MIDFVKVDTSDTSSRAVYFNNMRNALMNDPKLLRVSTMGSVQLGEGSRGEEIEEWLSSFYSNNEVITYVGTNKEAYSSLIMFNRQDDWTEGTWEIGFMIFKPRTISLGHNSIRSLFDIGFNVLRAEVLIASTLAVNTPVIKLVASFEESYNIFKTRRGKFIDYEIRVK